MLTIIVGIVYLLTPIVAFCGVCVWVIHKHKEMDKTKCQPDHSNAEEEAQQLRPDNEELEEETRQLQTAIMQLYDLCKDISQKLEFVKESLEPQISEDIMYDDVGQKFLIIGDQIGDLRTNVEVCFRNNTPFTKEMAMGQIEDFKKIISQLIDAFPDYSPAVGANFDITKMEDLDKTYNYDCVVREVVTPGKICGTVVISKAQVRVEAANSEEEGGTVDGAN